MDFLQMDSEVFFKKKLPWSLFSGTGLDYILKKKEFCIHIK